VLAVLQRQLVLVKARLGIAPPRLKLLQVMLAGHSGQPDVPVQRGLRLLHELGVTEQR
jgi:hypothetical protein